MISRQSAVGSLQSVTGRLVTSDWESGYGSTDFSGKQK